MQTSSSAGGWREGCWAQALKYNYSHLTICPKICIKKPVHYTAHPIIYSIMLISLCHTPILFTHHKHCTYSSFITTFTCVPTNFIHTIIFSFDYTLTLTTNISLFFNHTHYLASHTHHTFQKNSYFTKALLKYDFINTTLILSPDIIYLHVIQQIILLCYYKNIIPYSHTFII